MGETRTRSPRALITGLAVLGAVGFLTRVPVGHSERAWRAFTRLPAVMVLVAYPIGGLLALALVGGVPPATAGLLYPAGVIGLLGITHLDGVGDLGDAAVVHGDAERRRAVMQDTEVGVGAVAAIGLVLAGLVLAAYSLASAPWRVALSVVVAAEVTAKLGMVVLVARGTATHEGLASALTEHTGGVAVLAAGALALPAVGGPWTGAQTGLAWPATPALAAGAGGLVAALAVFWWARRNLDGVSGDVFGAANELSRVVALHAGVIAWTL